jgi:hypothetical protein
MTATQRVQRTQWTLRLVAVSGGLLWSGAVLFAGLMLAAALQAFVTLPPTLGPLLPLLVVLAAIATLAALVWRSRFVWSFDRVALWIEERAPELRYALVTAVDPRYRDTAGTTFDQAVSSVDTGEFVRRAAARSIPPAATAIMLTALMFIFAPSAWKDRFGVPAAFGGKAAPAPIVGNRLLRLGGTVTPPAYTNHTTERLDDPSTISGLQGSRVVLTGAGSPDGIHATLGEQPIPVVASSGGWSASFALSDSLPAALKMVDRQYTRLIVVDPRVDQSPAARLLSPMRDTTLRVVGGTLELSATFSDDVGLARARFEYIIANTGEGDVATARTGTLGARTVSGRNGTFAMNIPYALLNLVEGDLLSVRAVVIDNNTLYGPGIGYSETRAIRVARKGEYDSLSVTPAPPSADTAMMTLRMLIIATEKLERDRPTLARRSFVDSALKLAGKSEVVRQKIQAIIGEQTGGGEIAANPLLLQAADAMWSATMSLQIAETREAIPQLWIAYKALEKLRNEKRYYLRGKLPPVVVNIERVRLTGADTGMATPRAAVRPDAETEKMLLRSQYADAVRELQSNPEHAVELLTLLRVATLRTQPSVAAALGDAVTAVQSGTDATLPLLRARRALDGSAGALDTLPMWSGAW